MSCTMYIQYKENAFRFFLQSDESVAEGLEQTERLLEQTGQHRDQSLDACTSTIAQGEALLQELR